MRTTTGTTVRVAVLLVAVGLMGAATWAVLAGHVDAGIDLGVSALAVLGIALLVAQMRHAPHIEMRVDQEQLLIRFGGWDALWMLRRQVRVPLQQIDGVSVRHVDTRHPRWWGWWRHRGTAIAGLTRAGSFVNRGDRELWDVREGAEAVDIELADRARFRRLVLEVPDPAVAAEQLRASVGG